MNKARFILKIQRLAGELHPACRVFIVIGQGQRQDAITHVSRHHL